MSSSSLPTLQKQTPPFPLPARLRGTTLPSIYITSKGAVDQESPVAASLFLCKYFLQAWCNRVVFLTPPPSTLRDRRKKSGQRIFSGLMNTTSSSCKRQETPAIMPCCKYSSKPPSG